MRNKIFLNKIFEESIQQILDIKYTNGIYKIQNVTLFCGETEYNLTEWN